MSNANPSATAVPMEEASLLRQAKSLYRRLDLGAYLVSAALVCIAILVSAAAFPLVSGASLTLIFLIAIAVSAQRYGLWPSILASTLSVISWDYFFTLPYFSLELSSERDIYTLTIFFVVALSVSGMNALIHHKNRQLALLAAKNSSLYVFAKDLAAIDSVEEIANFAIRNLSVMLHRDVTLLLDERSAGGTLQVYPRGAAVDGIDTLSGTRLAAELYLSQTPASAEKKDMVFFPLYALRGLVGAARISGVLENPVPPAEREKLSALLGQVAVAIERIWLSEEHKTAQVAAEVERLRNALLISVSHDLRTPLTTIIGSLSTLEILQDGKGESDQAELASLALAEAQRLDRFIANLLDMTKLEMGNLNIKLAPIDVEDIVISVVERAQPLLEDHKIVVHVAPNLARVNANFDFLEQAMFNIIDNAGKYSPSHSVIEIVAHAEGDDIVIRIFDRGPGISDELAKIMFNKFARAAQGDSKSPGTGLGLAIASGFIRAMGGTVTGKNRSVGQGAVFTIKLPTYQPATVPTLCD